MFSVTGALGKLWQGIVSEVIMREFSSVLTKIRCLPPGSDHGDIVSRTWTLRIHLFSDIHMHSQFSFFLPEATTSKIMRRWLVWSCLHWNLQQSLPLGLAGNRAQPETFLDLDLPFCSVKRRKTAHKAHFFFLAWKWHSHFYQTLSKSVRAHYPGWQASVTSNMILCLGWKLNWLSEERCFGTSWEKNGHKILTTFRREYDELEHWIFWYNKKLDFEI